MLALRFYLTDFIPILIFLSSNFLVFFRDFMKALKSMASLNFMCLMIDLLDFMAFMNFMKLNFI
jgi:hypothetical protein